MVEFVKIVVYVPVDYADAVRQALAEAGAGHIGNYDYCSFSVKGTGRFRPGKGSHPFIGKAGVVEAVEEERIETICPGEAVHEVIEAVRRVHPYEEMAFDVYPLMNNEFL